MSGTSRVIRQLEDAGNREVCVKKTSSPKHCQIGRRMHNKKARTSRVLPNNCLVFIKQRCCWTRPGEPPGLHFFLPLQRDTGARLNSPSLGRSVCVFLQHKEACKGTPICHGLALLRQEIRLRQGACSFSSRGHKNPGGAPAPSQVPPPLLPPAAFIPPTRLKPWIQISPSPARPSKPPGWNWSEYSPSQQLGSP